MEPTSETFQKMGALCVAWSYLEMETERTLLGILKLDHEQARIFVWRMGMRQRWQMIVEECDTFLSSSNVAFLKAINKKIVVIMKDRNIIVHGLIHASAFKERPSGTQLSIKSVTPEDITTPCWTIFMGDGAGKRYAVSSESVSIVLENVR